MHRPTRSPLALLTWLLVAGTFAAPGAGAAGELWSSPAFSLSPQELLDAAESVPATDGGDVRLLLTEYLVRFEDDGGQETTYRIVYQVLSESGVDVWAATQSVWQPWHQDRPTLRSRVVTPEGTEHWLDPATIGESPLGDGSLDILSDRRVLEAPLPAVSVGAVVEESITTRDRQPLFAAGTVGSFEIAWQDIELYRTRLVLDAPESLPLRWVSQLLGDLEPRRETRDGRVVLTFETGPVAGIEEIEELAPGNTPIWPHIVFSTGESWAAVAAEYSRLVEAQLEAGPLEASAMAAVEGVDERGEKVDRLLAWLHQEVRYTGLEFAEAAIVPRSPTETLRRGYGDCKDKSTLLVALLRAAGLPAHLALLRTGSGPDVLEELPGLGAFDHAIVYVPGDPAIWIDPTDEFARAGELPVADQDRLALIADPATRELVLIPAAGAEENLLVETREIVLAADLGGAHVVETTHYWGAFGRQQRATLSRSEPAELEETYTSYMDSAYAAEEFVSWEHSDPWDLSRPFELRLEADGALTAFTDLTYAVVYLAPDSLLNYLPSVLLEESDDEDTEPDIAAPTRQADLVLPMPYSAEHRYRIVPPDGYRFISRPEPEELRLGPATLSRQVRLDDDGSFHLTYRFDTGKRRLLPAEIETLREGVHELFDAEALEIELEHVGEAHLEAGEIAEALRELDRLVAAAPQRALPRSRRARALLEGGLGAAARQEAEAAVALEADRYIVQQALGLVYVCDLVGREVHAGMDPERAEQAFRRAIELEPESEADRVNLAVLLVRDENGIAYASGARLEEAIEIYADMCDDPETFNCYEGNLLPLLAYSGRFDDLLERSTRAGRNFDAWSLAALVLSKGTEAALRGARKIRSDDVRREALSSAAQFLMQQRRYPEAADLMTAAAKGAEEPATILGLANLLRKTKRLEELELSGEEPADVVRQMLIAVVEGDRDKALGLISRGAKDNGMGDDLLKDYERNIAGVRRAVQRNTGTSLHGILELGFAVARPHSEGSDELGYRIRMQSSMAGIDASEETAFVVREGGAYRLAATDTAAHLGHEVLRRLESGDEAAARQWLDWAAEMVVAPAADDPYAGRPFFRLWTAGQEAGAEDMRVAAAALLSDRKNSAEKAVVILEEAIDGAGDDERRALEIALAAAYDRLGRDEPLAGLARGWLDSRPESTTAFRYMSNAFLRQKRYEEIRALAQERLELLADDPAAMRTLIADARRRRDSTEERRLYQRMIDSGDATAFEFNNLAWLDVVEGSVSEATLDLAQRAVSEGADRPDLHTLATAYAELGQGNEAREILLQAMSVGGDDAPRSEDWYTWGLIAESYGVPDAAAEAYAKVEPTEREEEMESSTYRLAQRRLEKLRSTAVVSTR